MNNAASADPLQAFIAEARATIEKHPVYLLQLGCLGLFVFSIIAFCVRDQSSEEKETWIEQSAAKTEEYKVPSAPRNSLAVNNVRPA